MLVAANTISIGARVSLSANGGDTVDVRGAGAGGTVALIAKNIVDAVMSGSRTFVSLFLDFVLVYYHFKSIKNIYY